MAANNGGKLIPDFPAEVNNYSKNSSCHLFYDNKSSWQDYKNKRSQGNNEQPIDIAYVIKELEMAGMDAGEELQRVLDKDFDWLDDEVKLNALTQLMKRELHIIK